jgi:hypothetical protein
MGLVDQLYIMLIFAFLRHSTALKKKSLKNIKKSGPNIENVWSGQR